MRQTIKKAVALLLMLVMTLSCVVVSVNATTDSNTTVTGTKVKGTDWTVTPVTSGVVEGTDYTVTKDEYALIVTNKRTTAITKVLAQTKVEGLKLTDDKIYTVDFSYGYIKKGQGKYLLFSGNDTYTANSIGWATSEDKVIIKKNGISSSVQTCTFSTVGVTPDSKTVDGLTVIDYRLILDVTNKIIKCYVLADGEFVEVLNYTGGFTFSGEDFYMSYYMQPAKGSDAESISNIVIYEGDLQKETQVEVNRGGSKETVTVLGPQYTLPTLEKREGYVAGWRVDDEASLTPAGTVISTDGLESITAVYDEVMSRAWVQFKTNADDASKTDIRIVGAIDSLYYDKLEYKVVVSADTTEICNDTITLTTVYDSLTAAYTVGGAEEPIYISDLGYTEGYLTAFAVRGLKGAITVELTPSWTVGSESHEGTTITFSVDPATQTVG